METELRARLKADAAIAGLVGTRIDWNERPQAKALPAVTITLVNDERDQSFDGINVTQGPLVQFDCWASDYVDMRALREAVISLISTAATQGGVRFMAAQNIKSQDRAERLDTGTVHYATVRANIWHTIP